MTNTPFSNNQQNPDASRWCSWHYEEYGVQYFHCDDDLPSKMQLMTPADDQDPDLISNGVNQIKSLELIHPAADDQSPNQLIMLLRLHRLLAIYTSRPAFYAPAGWHKNNLPVLVHGLPFSTWDQGTFLQDLNSQFTAIKDARLLFKYEIDIKAYMCCAASLTFNSMTGKSR